jgi:hypothetical protein
MLKGCALHTLFSLCARRHARCFLRQFLNKVSKMRNWLNRACGVRNSWMHICHEQLIKKLRDAATGGSEWNRQVHLRRRGKPANP